MNNVQLVEVDNHSFLSSYIMNRDSFYLHRKVIEVLPSVKIGIQTVRVIKLNPCKLLFHSNNDNLLITNL